MRDFIWEGSYKQESHTQFSKKKNYKRRVEKVPYGNSMSTGDTDSKCDEARWPEAAELIGVVSSPQSDSLNQSGSLPQISRSPISIRTDCAGLTDCAAA